MGSGVIHYNISDHDIVYINFKKVIPPKEKITFKYRDFKKLNLAVLHHRFIEYDWTVFYNSQNPTECWDVLYSAYLEILNEIAPIINMNAVKGRDEWVNKEVLDAINEREDFRAKLRYSNDDELQKSFRKAKNKIRQLSNKARQEFTQDKIETVKHDPRKFWKELTTLMPGKKSKSKQTNSITLHNDNGEIISDAMEAASYANRYYVNIGPKVSEKIIYDNTEYLRDLNELMEEEDIK